METIRKIRLAARDKKSRRQIARDLRLSRNTVRKVLRSGETRFEYRRETVHRPQLARYIETLEGWLEAEQSLAVKQRRTMLLLYEALQEEGYRGGYDTVRRYVKGWREARAEGVSDVYVPLSFEPGEGFCQVAEGRASVTGTKHVSSISRHKSPHPRYRVPWREGHDSLLPAIDDAPVETDCGAGYEHSRIVAHVHQNESRAFGILALGYVRVTLQHDCSRIDPGSAAQRA